jgi:flagellin
MEILSSGLRINRAADDASGLSISEKMRGQIRGLSRAAQNIQDGISYVQVADGALSEVTEMLNRMRVLFVDMY